MLKRMSEALRLKADAEQLPTLEHVFRWALRHDPRLQIEDVVIQDEYTHDVLLAAGDGSYLAFDTT